MQTSHWTWFGDRAHNRASVEIVQVGKRGVQDNLCISFGAGRPRKGIDLHAAATA
jgi:hypothetical protein